jgi:hypothetical protein
MVIVAVVMVMVRRGPFFVAVISAVEAATLAAMMVSKTRGQPFCPIVVVNNNMLVSPLLYVVDL